MILDWIPVYTSILDSTLWEEPTHVRLMFFTLMFMKDPGDHVVREPLRRISKVANLSEDREEAYRLAEEAIKILSSPDTRSNEKQEHEGRRIVQVEGGWWVVNGEYYEKMRKELGARIRKSQLQRVRRAKARGETLTGEAIAVAAMGRGDQATADVIAAERKPRVVKATPSNGVGPEHIGPKVAAVVARLNPKSSGGSVPISEPAGVKFPEPVAEELDEPPVYSPEPGE